MSEPKTREEVAEAKIKEFDDKRKAAKSKPKPNAKK